MTEFGNADKPMVSLRLTANIVTDPETAFEKQQRILELVQELGGVACEVSIAPTEIIDAREPIARSAETEEADPRLEMGIGKAMRQFVDKSRPNRDSLVARAENILSREGVSSVRDVLVVGRTKIRDSRNVGTLTEDVVEEALSGAVPGITWQEAPSMTDMVYICPDVLDIPGLAVDRDLGELRLRDILTVPLSQLAEHYLTYHGRSEEGYQAAFEGEPENIGGRNFPDIDRAMEAQTKARAFAARYLAERARLMQSK